MGIKMIEVKTIDALLDIIKSSEKVVVDFWSTTCAPCKAFLPIFEQVSAEIHKVAFVKVNVTEVPEVVKEFGLRAVPAVLAFSHGVKVKDHTGLMTEKSFYSFAISL